MGLLRRTDCIEAMDGWETWAPHGAKHVPGPAGVRRAGMPD